jgi:hypothetical protein
VGRQLRRIAAHRVSDHRLHGLCNHVWHHEWHGKWHALCDRQLRQLCVRNAVSASKCHHHPIGGRLGLLHGQWYIVAVAVAERQRLALCIRHHECLGVRHRHRVGLAVAVRVSHRHRHKHGHRKRQRQRDAAADAVRLLERAAHALHHAVGGAVAQPLTLCA